MVCTPVSELEDLTLAHVRPLVGRRFHAETPSGRRIQLLLIDVQDNRPRRRPPARGRAAADASGALVAESRPGDGPAGGPAPRGDLVDPTATRPFTLLFLGPPESPLSEGDYDLHLPWLPLRGLRLSPLGPGRHDGAEGLLYESVVD